MPRGEDRPGEHAVQRTAVELDPVDRKGERREHVDVGRVGAEQARRHGEARTALEPHLAEQRAGQCVGDIVQSAAADQSLCGSFSTCQVWPLVTSAWRSGVLPEAAAAFCSIDRAFEGRRGILVDDAERDREAFGRHLDQHRRDAAVLADRGR